MIRKHGLVGGPDIGKYSIAPKLWPILYADVRTTVIPSPSSADLAALFCPSAGFCGFSIARPLKADAARLCQAGDECTRLLGLCNTVVPSQQGPWAWNTDGIGLRYAVEEAGLVLLGARVLVLGCGGAGLSAAFEFLKAGAVVWLSDIVQSRQEYAVSALERYGARHWTRDVWEFEALVNATPEGMHVPESPAGPSSPLSDDELARVDSQYWVEMNYNPYWTVFLTHARRLGRIAVPGASMLYHQAREAGVRIFSRPPSLACSEVVDRLLQSGAICSDLP